MEEPHSTQTPSATSFEKDLEIQSHTPYSNSPHHQTDIDKEEKGEKVDIEAEEEEFDENDPHGDGYGGRGDESALGAGVTRTSTKSSWKDPGPPPDGGWSGWTQGESRSFHCLEDRGEMGWRGVLKSRSGKQGPGW